MILYPFISDVYEYWSMTNHTRKTVKMFSLTLSEGERSLKNNNMSNQACALQKTPNNWVSLVVECDKVSLKFLNSCIAGCSLSSATAVNFQPLQLAGMANLAYFWNFVANYRTLGEQAVVVDRYLCNCTLHRWRDLATFRKNGLTKIWMQPFIQKVESNW